MTNLPVLSVLLVEYSKKCGMQMIKLTTEQQLNDAVCSAHPHMIFELHTEHYGQVRPNVHPLRSTQEGSEAARNTEKAVKNYSKHFPWLTHYHNACRCGRDRRLLRIYQH